jgi:hypothetical protein
LSRLTCTHACPRSANWRCNLDTLNMPVECLTGFDERLADTQPMCIDNLAGICSQVSCRFLTVHAPAAPPHPNAARLSSPSLQIELLVAK